METQRSKNGGKKRLKKKNIKNIGEGEDRLSSLPDCLLVDILSLLQTKHAVVTSVLSQRWRHLWTHATRFDVFPEDDGKDLIAIGGIFSRLTSPEIHVFSLWCDDDCMPHLEAPQVESVTSCIRNVCLRNVKKIKVMLDGIVVPNSVYNCESLESLILRGSFECEGPQDVPIVINLPNLKSLNLCLSDDSRMLMNTLFKSCPLLEKLILDFDFYEDDPFVDISSSSLKSLVIRRHQHTFGTKIMIDAPNLVELDVYGCSSQYVFVKVPTKLVKGQLNVMCVDCEDCEEVDDSNEHFYYTTRFLLAVSSVPYLKFSCSTKLLVYLYQTYDGILPKFRNLTHLDITLDGRSEWKRLLQFLHCFPKLEFLDVWTLGSEGQDPHWSSPVSVPACLVSQLKKMNVMCLWGRNSDFKLLEYVLCNAGVLEKLVVSNRPQDKRNEDKLWKDFRFCAALFKHPRRSAVCQIEYSGYYITTSGNAFKDSRLNCQISYTENSSNVTFSP